MRQMGIQHNGYIFSFNGISIFKVPAFSLHSCRHEQFSKMHEIISLVNNFFKFSLRVRELLSC